MNGYLYVWSFTYMVILCCWIWWHLINLIVTKRLKQREATYLLISNYVSKGRQLFVICNYVRCYCDNEWRFVLGINIRRVGWKTVVTAFLFHIKLQQFPPFQPMYTMLYSLWLIWRTQNQKFDFLQQLFILHKKNLYLSTSIKIHK